MAKYWVIHPEMYNPDKDGRVFPPVAIVPRKYYDYESDPEYVLVEFPDLVQPGREEK